MNLSKAIDGFNGGRVLVGISRLPFKCPVAPYETALLLDSYFRRKGIRDKVDMRFFTPEPYPIPAAGPEYGSMLSQMLMQRGIEFRPNTLLREIRSNEVVLDDLSMPYDMLYCIPPHIAPKVVVNAGLTDHTGFIPVNPRTMETIHGNVYAQVSSFKIGRFKNC